MAKAKKTANAPVKKWVITNLTGKFTSHLSQSDTEPEGVLFVKHEDKYYWWGGLARFACRFDTKGEAEEILLAVNANGLAFDAADVREINFVDKAVANEKVTEEKE